MLANGSRLGRRKRLRGIHGQILPLDKENARQKTGIALVLDENTIQQTATGLIRSLAHARSQPRGDQAASKRSVQAFDARWYRTG